MSQIHISDAVALAKIIQRIAQGPQRHRNWSGADEFVTELAKLRLDRLHVQPALDAIERKCGYDADGDYGENSRFYPPAPRAAAAEPDPRPDFDPDAEYEYDDVSKPPYCIRFQGVDLETALHGPIVPRSETKEEIERLFRTQGSAYIDPRRIRGFPFEQVFARFKIADRVRFKFDRATKKESTTPTPDGIWITPWHPHEPGDRCCYSKDESDDPVKRGNGEGFGLGCEGGEGHEYGCSPYFNVDSNAMQLFRYLQKGLITLDELAPLLYGQPASEALPDTPSGTYPDSKLGLFILDGVEPVRVCNVVTAVAEVDDECGKRQGRQIRFWDGKAWQLHVIAARLLEGEGSSLYQELATRGLDVSPEPAARAAFRRIVKEPRGLPTVVEYSKPGWHGHRFVLPTGYSLSAKTIGPAQVYVAREAATVDQSQGGTYDTWVKDVAEQIWKGDTPQFAMGQLAGMCGVVSSLLLLEHPVIHFSGPTRSGKSTAQAIACGLTCNPMPGQGTLVELQQDVEGVLPKGAGTCASIDDPTKHGSPTTVERLMYRAMSCCPFTVSSVASLEQIVERAGGKMNEGIRCRVITVDTRKAPRIDPFRAADIKKAALENFGWAAPWFLDHLMQGPQATLNRDVLLKRIRDHVRALPGDMTDGETVSAAMHIGLLRVVGELMIGAGLIPPEADVAGLLLSVWNDWLERRSATPVNRALAEIDAALHDAGPFGENDGGPCWKMDGVGYIPVSMLPEIIGDEIEARHVVRHLKEIGRLKPCGAKNLAWPKLDTPSGRVDCTHYRITLA
jgi:uncharacterized protein DUF927